MSIYKISTSAVITYQHKIILIKENNSGTIHWDIPAGGLEIGETPEEGIVREVKEETGIRISNPILGKIYHYVEPKRTTVNYLFTIDVGALEDKLKSNTSDVEEVRLFENDEIEEMVNRGKCENSLAAKRLSDYIVGFPSKLSIEVLSSN